MILFHMTNSKPSQCCCFVKHKQQHIPRQSHFSKWDMLPKQWTPLHMQLEGFGDIRTSKNWSRIQSLLHHLEYMLLLMTPSSRLVLAHENGDRLGDQAKFFDKSMVVIHQAPKNTKSRHIDRCWNLLQNVHLSLLHHNTSWNNHIT